MFEPSRDATISSILLACGCTSLHNCLLPRCAQMPISLTYHFVLQNSLSCHFDDVLMPMISICMLPFLRGTALSRRPSPSVSIWSATTRTRMPSSASFSSSPVSIVLHGTPIGCNGSHGCGLDALVDRKLADDLLIAKSFARVCQPSFTDMNKGVCLLTRC